MRKRKTLADALGKAPLEEEQEVDKPMEEDSPLRIRLCIEEDKDNFSSYISPRRADALRVDLPKKVNTTLVAFQIHQWKMRD